MKSVTKESTSPSKYWYSTEVECCVICGVERKSKARVYCESEKGIVWRDTMCWSHYF